MDAKRAHDILTPGKVKFSPPEFDEALALARDALAREIPMEPVYHLEPWPKHKLKDVPGPFCAVCDHDLLDEANDGYERCPECGQTVDWNYFANADGSKKEDFVI